MNRKAAQAALGIGFLLILAFNAELLRAQETNATLSGTVADSSGKAIANARVTLKNVATDQSVDAVTDSSGSYTLANLPPGDYEISASAGELSSAGSKLTLAPQSRQTLSLTLAAANQHAPPTAPSPNLPNAPSSSQAEPSLEDLGFPRAETQSNAAQQALLDKRTHMLKIHQRMGLITAAPLLATLITSVGAGGKSTSTSSRDLHVALGALTGDLYGITAYYAIRAPRIPGTKTRGPIRFHKAMAWIHGPGMILTPILGAMAFDQKSNGEKVHGIASAHGPVAIVTAAAFGAALLSVSVKF
jgi:Carboxypeptidase regulatory-like domain